MNPFALRTVKLRGGLFDGQEVHLSPLELDVEVRVGGTIDGDGYTVVVETFYQIVGAENVEADFYLPRPLLADFVKEFRHPLPLISADGAR